MTTLVQARHPGKGPNGFGGCHTRWTRSDGLCSGVVTAEWLNGLGEDEAPFGMLARVTNGEVRRNWLRGDSHIELQSTPPHTYDCPRCQGSGRITVKP